MKIPFEAMENKIPLMFQFLANEDDDVSGAVSKFAHDYITVLKTLPELTDGQRQRVKELLFVVVKKMKFDESYSFDSEVSTSLALLMQGGVPVTTEVVDCEELTSSVGFP